MNTSPQKGKLKRWNDDRGFGFVASNDGSGDIFIHISAFKKMGRRPIIGDIITYQTHTDSSKKKRAVNARIEGIAEIKLSPRRNNSKKQKKKSWISNIFLIALVLATGSITYTELIKPNDSLIESSTSILPYVIDKQNTENYSCTGKVYCSEMTSCDEAKFYLRNCPETKMDGDGDGIPCERQWCSW
jgi:cold shock CspA family protein